MPRRAAPHFAAVVLTPLGKEVKTMSKQRLAAGTALVLAVATFAAVLSAGAGARPVQAQGTVKLGFITKFPVDFYFTLVGGAKTWQKSHKNVSVMYAQGKAATDDAGEIAAIQNMIASGVKGIAITPTSPAVISALNKAVKAGIKVVLMDNDLPTWKLKSSVVSTNNRKGGTLAGKWLAAKLKAGATLGILEGVPGVPALDDRVTGMLAGLGATKSKIKIVSKLETDCDQTKGAQAAQTILTANPNLTAIYSACGPPALGAIQSIKNAGAKVILVGFDGLTDEVAAVKAGTEAATVAQHPAKIGSLGIATLYKAVSGQKVPKNVDTGTSLITAANAK
jgi:ribose transport system substrate-binding protein